MWRRYGADKCVDVNGLQTLMQRLDDDELICLDPSKQTLLQQSFSSSKALVSIENKQKALEHALVASRAIKTKADIACLQHASNVSTQAHLAMWR